MECAEGEGHVTTETGVARLPAKEGQGLPATPAAGGHKEGLAPAAFGGSAALPTWIPAFRPPEQGGRGQLFCYFSPPAPLPPVCGICQLILGLPQISGAHLCSQGAAGW